MHICDLAYIVAMASITPDRFAHAINDPTRMRILALLGGAEELCVCELTAALELPQPKISRHLAVLRNSGLAASRRDGTWIHYRLHPQLPAWSREALAALTRGCERREPYRSDRGRIGSVAQAACG